MLRDGIHTWKQKHRTISWYYNQVIKIEAIMRDLRLSEWRSWKFTSSGMSYQLVKRSIKIMYHTSLKGITSFPCICLFCSVLPPPFFPPSAFRAHTCVYVARAKVNVSRSFLPCHAIHDTHISTGYGVTWRVLTYQVTWLQWVPQP